MIAEKIIGVIILKQWRYVVSDSTIIKLPVLILSALARLYNLMVKTRDYQHMGLLRMHVQNQWKASSMTVESSLNVEQLFQEGLGILMEPTNIPLLLRGRLGMSAGAHA